MKELHFDYIVLGGGIAGLSFAANINSKSVRVIEKSNEPGGLIKSVKVDDFWFDSVVHLLHFQNDEDKTNLAKYITPEFAPILQKADVITEAGITKFPFQLNLGGLPKEVAISCTIDYINKTNEKPSKIDNFKQWLAQSFGQKMCEVFFYPYNEKMWKRPLESLATRDFTWTIQKFNLDKIVGGLILNVNNNESYNLNSLYPKPKKNSPKRCMGILTENIYNDIRNMVQLNEEVCEINTDDKYIMVKTRNEELKKYSYSKECISTIPLPQLQKITTPKLPTTYEFKTTGVIYAMVMLKGKKNDAKELSSYYSSSEYVFSRLIHMQNFDPDTAPLGCWSLMAEITYNENDKPTLDLLEPEIKDNLLKLKIVQKSDDFIKIHFEVHPYAYAVFEKETARYVVKLSEFYKSKSVHLLGRYGKWQYISMAQGYTEAKEMAEMLTSN